MKIFTKRRIAIATVATAVASIAFFAFGGPAKAADLIDGGDVKDQSLFSPDLGPDSVGPSELKPKAVTHKEMSAGTWDFLQKGKTAFDQNKTQQTDINALKATNTSQDAKVSDLEDRVEAQEAEGDTVGINTARAGAGYTNSADPGYSVKFAKCAPGKVAISGGYRLNGHASEAFSGSDQNAMPEGLTVVATEPAGVVDGVLVNTYQHPDFPQTEGGSFQGNAWAVTFKNDTENPLPVRVWATCVNAS
jgi:hypothetical protein